jgi:hypothetical protein
MWRPSWLVLGVPSSQVEKQSELRVLCLSCRSLLFTSSSGVLISCGIWTWLQASIAYCRILIVVRGLVWTLGQPRKQWVWVQKWIREPGSILELGGRLLLITRCCRTRVTSTLVVRRSCILVTWGSNISILLIWIVPWIFQFCTWIASL